MNRIEAVLFDMDGTLGDTTPVVVQALQETFSQYAGRHYSHDEICAMFGPSEEGVIGRRVSQADYPGALSMYLRRYHELHGRETFPGALELLTWLHARGIRTAIVTGKGQGTMDISVERMGLGSVIDRVEVGTAAGAEKDAAMMRILDEWGIAPENAAYVGDAEYDMQAATAVGVQPLGAGWAETTMIKEGQGYPFFRSFAELKAWLEERIG